MPELSAASSKETDAEQTAPLGGKASEEAPVQFELFNREWQNMASQDNWDGFRIEAANQVTKQLQAAHTLLLGTQLRETGYIYQFGPAFQSEDQRTMLFARAGLDGFVNGRAIQKVGSSMEVKASTNLSLKELQRNVSDFSFEYNARDWTMGTKLAWQGAWFFGGAFSQDIAEPATGWRFDACRRQWCDIHRPDRSTLHRGEKHLLCFG